MREREKLILKLESLAEGRLSLLEDPLTLAGAGEDASGVFI
jgi:hypothetical protein